MITKEIQILSKGLWYKVMLYLKFFSPIKFFAKNPAEVSGQAKKYLTDYLWTE